MVRVLVCAAALLSCSAVRAERIIVTSASATYFTDSQRLSIAVRFDRPIDLSEDFFLFWAGSPIGQWPPDEGFALRNDDNRNVITDTVKLTHIDYLPRGRVLQTDMGVVDYQIIDTTLLFDLPLPLADARFDFQAGAYGVGGGAPSIEGHSSINQRVVYTPEPSTFALIGIAAAHLIWLPRLRKRFAQRHVGGKVVDKRAV